MLFHKSQVTKLLRLINYFFSFLMFWKLYTFYSFSGYHWNAYLAFKVNHPLHCLSNVSSNYSPFIFCAIFVQNLDFFPLVKPKLDISSISILIIQCLFTYSCRFANILVIPSCFSDLPSLSLFSPSKVHPLKVPSVEVCQW